MLFLVCRVGEDRYLLESSQIIEVVPLVQWKTVRQAPAGIVGMFNFHGQPVPLIDLANLMRGTASPHRMSTRIVVVNGVAGSDQTKVLFGLLAEGVTETVRLSEADFHSDRLAIAQTPYLGAVAVRESGILQRIELPRLAPEQVRSAWASENFSLA